ncbi:MAG: hypothetical protein M1823_004397 [Watsoniomyces obsoletus]|nr:MAG: hypothetical protein M1823_004397 [Watsoniomyces obsoletus]
MLVRAQEQVDLAWWPRVERSGITTSNTPTAMADAAKARLDRGALASERSNGGKEWQRNAPEMLWLRERSKGTKQRQRDAPEIFWAFHPGSRRDNGTQSAAGTAKSNELYHQGNPDGSLSI